MNRLIESKWRLYVLIGLVLILIVLLVLWIAGVVIKLPYGLYIAKVIGAVGVICGAYGQYLNRKSNKDQIRIMNEELKGKRVD